MGDYRWYKVWPVWAPKEIEINRPICEYIREWAELRPEAKALTFYGKDITYAEFNELTDRLSHGLIDLGVKKGDRVAVHMNNCPQFVISYFAVHRAGGIAVPINPMFKGLELEYELNDAGAETLIGVNTLFAEIEKIRCRLHLKNVILTSMENFLPAKPDLNLPDDFKQAEHAFPDTIDFLQLIKKSSDQPVCNITDLKKDIALLQYTGGTTGIPKGAIISHYSLTHAAVGGSRWYNHREDDVFLGVTPFFHVMGQIAQLCDAIVSGSRVIILSRFVPDVVAEAITRYRCTHWSSATTMIIAILSLNNLSDYDFSSFRCIANGGTPISAELLKKLKELAPNMALVEGFGLSESASQGGACTPLFRHKTGFIGIPQINVIIKIVDPKTGKELGPNKEGEIIIKSPSLMSGYWNNPEETKEMLRDGWLHTGDTGLMDEEGYLKFLGRSRELIKCSGFSVFPAEVEDILYKHPAVKEAAVIGVDDEYRGESPKAFIILKDAYVGKITEKEILDWSADNMASYKRPRFVEFKDELPKTAAGKVLKRVLKEGELQKK